MSMRVQSDPYWTAAKWEEYPGTKGLQLHRQTREDINSSHWSKGVAPHEPLPLDPPGP